MSGTELTKWTDGAMFEAEPITKDQESGMVLPIVHLVAATPDPLGAIAAACRMYEGKGTRMLTDITDDERKHYWEQSIKTHLKAPWEFVDLHFFIEGVTRAFTHQMVRQRTAVYAQESMRFAVKSNMAEEVALPPSLIGRDEDDKQVQRYRMTVEAIETTYNNLVSNGIPAEDARHLLPHATTTRLNYKTNLRGLVEHAGNRLCTQAQFEWRLVFAGIVKAIKTYHWRRRIGEAIEIDDFAKWQWQLIADSEVFRPVCYAQGRCPFKASFDRGCTIRDRVDEGRFDKIDNAEWLADPSAAWVRNNHSNDQEEQ